MRKVSHKIDNQGLNINIKRNQSIWAIFNEEDEKTLIDIPGKYLVESPIQELEELLGIKNIVNENNNSNNGQNPFAKPVNINININNNNKTNIDNNQTNLIQKGENACLLHFLPISYTTLKCLRHLILFLIYINLYTGVVGVGGL